jgi:hypothetical protein
MKVIFKSPKKMGLDPEEQPDQLTPSNIIPSKKVKITFKNANEKPYVTDYTLTILKEILTKANVSQATITSTIRTPESQAALAYNTLIKGKELNYKSGSRLLTQIFLDMGINQKPREEIIKVMAEKIDKMIQSGGHISSHVNPYNTLFYNVLDLKIHWASEKENNADDAIAKEQRKNKETELYSLFKTDPRIKVTRRRLYSKNKLGFHLEIPQPLAFKNDEIASLEVHKPLSALAKYAIERARGLPLRSLSYVNYPYIFYIPGKINGYDKNTVAKNLH